MSERNLCPSFRITVDDRPYMGESSEVENADPRWTGWSGRSPASRQKLLFGNPITDTGKIIVGKINLRSELDRILRHVESRGFTNIQITSYK